MTDILALRKMLGTDEIDPKWKEMYQLRVTETYSYSHPSLKKTKEEFFSNDGVNYVYDHDSIHEAVKIYDRPAFELIREDNADVFCSKDRFFAMPRELQLATVYEESATLALERSQIPNNFNINPTKSFLIALEKVCTSISSGWWRTFAWENYSQVLQMHLNRMDYVERFIEAQSKGLIKPYRGEKDV